MLLRVVLLLGLVACLGWFQFIYVGFALFACYLFANGFVVWCLTAFELYLFNSVA